MSPISMQIPSRPVWSRLRPAKTIMWTILVVNVFEKRCVEYVASIYRVLELPSLADRDCYFDPGCIIFHFPKHLICPAGYTFRNGGGRGKTRCLPIHCAGSVVRRWVLEAATSINGPWTVISSHPEDDTFFYDVTDGQDKENSFLYTFQCTLKL